MYQSARRGKISLTVRVFRFLGIGEDLKTDNLNRLSIPRTGSLHLLRLCTAGPPEFLSFRNPSESIRSADTAHMVSFKEQERKVDTSTLVSTFLVLVCYYRMFAGSADAPHLHIASAGVGGERVRAA